MAQPGQLTEPDSGANGDGDLHAKVSDVAEQAQQKAQQATGQVQERLREQLDQRSSQLATQINEQASDLRAVSESLREQGKDGPAKASDQLARYAQRIGGYLQEKDSAALLTDAEALGRRQPWATAAAGLALGFAASRLLKASSSRRLGGAVTVPRPRGIYPAADERGPSNAPRAPLPPPAPAQPAPPHPAGPPLGTPAA
ncbi:MAG: hypothetical protein JWM66_62 [Solirubrobacterales bacterium]|nr:hypothetical protein [Solirubrobacterales bacterium]